MSQEPDCLRQNPRFAVQERQQPTWRKQRGIPGGRLRLTVKTRPHLGELPLNQNWFTQPPPLVPIA